MLLPEIEVALSNFSIEWNSGKWDKAREIYAQNHKQITGKDIIEWEQLHKRSIE